MWLPEGDDPDKFDDIIRSFDRNISTQKGETENYFFVVFKTSVYDEVYHPDLNARGVRVEFTLRGLKKP